MGKRKREGEPSGAKEDAPRKTLKPADTPAVPTPPDAALTVQIITGSYERVLHGILTTVSKSKLLDDAAAQDAVQFSDSFLFNAHDSAIRCLALSPVPDSYSKSDISQSQKIILASGGSDERINLYNLSTSAPAADGKYPSVPTLAGNKILENPKNRELGSLLHHSSSISALYFPTRSKLITAAEDNTISVARTRDWSVVSTIKVPRPKAHGRPSGDTAPPGAGPSGVTDFAVHPSMKLMLSVGKGEKCMRLWNLVTGKKAGVLNFSRDLLESVKEGKWSSGEGRHVLWDPEGQEFAVAFERGAVIFGVDSLPRCRILPSPPTKLHSMKYVSLGESDRDAQALLAVSTEDGRILFYNTKSESPASSMSQQSGPPIPLIQPQAQLGGKSQGQLGRIKEFEILPLLSTKELKGFFLIITCGSDGTVRVWSLKRNELLTSAKQSKDKKSKEKRKEANESSSGGDMQQVGRLLSAYETGNRITCMKAFVMQQPQEDADSSGESEAQEEEQDSSDESSDEEDES